MYVVRRGDRFWFRKAVPVDLVDVLGIDEVRRSLRTRSAREARRRALEVLVRVEEVYAVLRSERPMRPARDVALALLEDALRSTSGMPEMVERKAQLLQEAACVLRSTGDGDHGVARRNGVADFLDRARRSDAEPITYIDADEALRRLRFEGPRGEENKIAVAILEAVARMGRGHLKDTNDGARDLDAALSALSALREGAPAPRAAFPMEELRALIASHFTPQHAPGMDAQAVRAVVAAELREGIARAENEKWSGMLLSAAIEKFETVEVPHRGGQKHRDDIPRRLANFLSVVGDKPIRDVSRDDVREYRDLLDKLPDRFVLHFGTRDIRKAIAANQKRTYPYAIIKKPTVDLKYLGPVSRLFQFLVKEKLLGSNPVDDIRSLQKEVSSAKSKRLPLKPDHINRLFADTVRQPVMSATYWVPVIMLYSGARPGEIAQLRVGDLRKEYNDRPHINLLCLQEDEEEEPDVLVRRKPPEDARRVKTEAGRRLISIHPELVRMGLLDLFERRSREVGPTGQLFRDVEPNAYGHYSAALTKRINRRLRSLGITNPRFVLYSLRHNFIEACNAAGMPAVTRQKIVGHQTEGMGGIYGNPRPEKWESDWIEKIAYEGLYLDAYLKLGMAGKIQRPGSGRTTTRQS